MSGQDLSDILNFVAARASFVLGQLPTATAFAITSNGGTNFASTNSTVTLTGTAPIQVKTIEVNHIPYAVTWSSPTAWTLTVPLFGPTNLLLVQGVDGHGNRPTNALDSITVTNTGSAAPLPVGINEWMADNAPPGGFANPADGLFPDWFELFNPNEAPVNLSGFFLTDDLAVPTRWRIPTNTVIAGRGFLLVWADHQTGQNSGLAGSDLHAAFQLSAGGEAIGLFAPDGVTPQSVVVYGPQMANVSQGLFPDGDTNAVYFMTNFTPRAANTLAVGLAITAISADAQKVTLTWSAIPGRVYRVEYKDRLEAAVWTPWGAQVVAGAGTASAADTMPSLTQRFYRVEVLP